MAGHEPQRAHTRHHTRRVLLATGAAVVAVAAVLVFASHLKSTTSSADARLDVIAPDFALRDQLGRPTELVQFRGKVVVLTFIDPECTEICPLTTQSMVDAVHLLPPAEAARVQLLGIDANPNKTQVADVAAYTRAHDLSGRWRFLTGPDRTLEDVWHRYNVYVDAVKGDIEHDPIVFLIDAKGHERQVLFTAMRYASVGDQARTIAADVGRLLSGAEPLPAPATDPGDATDSTPRLATVQLASFGAHAQSIGLGRAHPHLVVFFAEWLGTRTNLAHRLAALDGYAQAARRHHWPLPVAIDVRTTEASPAAARDALTPLAASLRTPIVEDTTGVLADSSQVEDLPWFALTSPTGDIVWHHDGWLTAAQLRESVHTVLAAP